MEKKECEICFEMKELVNIHDNHFCCNDCLGNIIKNPNITYKEGPLCRCPFCRHNICKTDDKYLNLKLKKLYIQCKVYRREQPKNIYRFLKRIKKDNAKSIKMIYIFKNKKMFKRINNYKKHF